MPTMDPIDLSPTDLTIVLHILRRYVPEREVVAFGSRATWTTRPGSDLDLAVLGETPLRAEVMAAMKDAFDESSLTFAVDIVDWAATKESFREIIRRDQILVKPAEPPASRDDWQELTIGDVADVFDGPHATPPKVDAGPIFLGISNLVNGRLDLSEVEHISSEDYERWTKRVTPRAGDVVFSYETRLGEAALLPEGLKCCLGRRMGSLRAKTDLIDPRFLLYSFLGPDFQATIRSRTIHGSTVDRIPLADLPRFPIRVPKRMSDQCRIAEILGALDDRVELNRRMNETLEALSATIFTCWFSSQDITWVPAHQLIDEHVLAIGDGYRARNSELSDTGLPFARAADVSGTVKVSDQTEHLSPESVAAAGEKISRLGDVVITTKGTVGRVARVSENTRRFVYSPQLCYWRSLDASLDPYVLFMWICSGQFREQLERVSGQTDMAPYVSLRDQRNFSVPRFAPSAQAAISATLKPLIDRQAHNESESETLAQLRNTLLPKLLSGELRVPAAERELAGHV